MSVGLRGIRGEHATGRSTRDGLGNGFFGQSPAPFGNNSFPSHAHGYLLQHIGNQDACATKGELTVTDSRVSNDVAS